MLVLKWKERAFIEKMKSRCFCWFPAAITVHQYSVSIPSSTNMRETFRLQHPPRAHPGHLTPLPSRGGGNLIIRFFQGVGNLIPMHEGWGIWTTPSISCKIFGVASYNWGPGVRGFSWKRLCLCGQLVARKGLKQALCRIWKYLNSISIITSMTIENRALWLARSFALSRYNWKLINNFIFSNNHQCNYTKTISRLRRLIVKYF